MDPGAPAQAGNPAAHLIATQPGTMALASQYWLAETNERASHTMRLWAHATDNAISGVTAALELLDAEGTVLATAIGTSGNNTGWHEIQAGPVQAMTGGKYVRAVVTASAASAGAALHVDAVEVFASTPVLAA